MTEESGVKPGEREEFEKWYLTTPLVDERPKSVLQWEAWQARGGSEDDLRECLRGLAEACALMRKSNEAGFNIFSHDFVRPWGKFYEALARAEKFLNQPGTGNGDSK